MGVAGDREGCDRGCNQMWHNKMKSNFYLALSMNLGSFSLIRSGNAWDHKSCMGKGNQGKGTRSKLKQGKEELGSRCTIFQSIQIFINKQKSCSQVNFSILICKMFCFIRSVFCIAYFQAAHWNLLSVHWVIFALELRFS